MSAAIIELSVKVITSDGASPFESRVSVSADERVNAEAVAVAWIEMMRRALDLARLQRDPQEGA